MYKSRRAALRVAAVMATAAAATALIASPAVASPTSAAPYPGCTDPIDGATVCYEASKSPTNPESRATLALADDREFAGALVVLEACDAGDVCTPVATQARSGVSGMSTIPVPRDPAVDHYRANASWVDDLGNFHTGVTAQYG